MSDLRKQLIHLAHANPALRADILPLVQKQAREFGTEEARKNYLQQHPNADPRRHTVKKKTEEPAKEAPKKDEGGGKSEKKVDLKKIPDDAKPQDLPPEAREEIADYKISIVGDNAKQAVEIARKLKKGIDRAADICKMSPSVCKGNKGLTRDKMPQIEGEKTVKQLLASDKADEKAKGQAMVEAGADPDSDKTVLQQLVGTLEKHGIKSTRKKIPVGKLKATQSEIKAEKVFGIADAHLKGKFDNIADSVIVSKDGHILDGHHRWAGLLSIDPGREMNVQEIDLTMDELLAEAAALPGVYKADFSGKPLPKKDQEEYKAKNKSKFSKKEKDEKSEKKGRSLRASLIQLAYSHPELRPHLLPVLAK